MELYQAVFTVGLLFYEMSPLPDPREWQISGLGSLLLITCTHKCELQSFNHCSPIILGLARQTAWHVQCTDFLMTTHKAFRTVLCKCQNKPEQRGRVGINRFRSFAACPPLSWSNIQANRCLLLSSVWTGPFWQCLAISTPIVYFSNS